MSAANRVPPAWVLSIPVATFGLVFGFIIVTMPQILAAQGVPGDGRDDGPWKLKEPQDDVEVVSEEAATGERIDSGE